MAAEDTDRYAWLEDVTGDKPLSWVKEQNAKSEARLAQTPAFKQMETRIREVLDSDAKIPGVQKIGDYYYNFWKDQQHERGLWRRTTPGRVPQGLAAVGDRARPGCTEQGRG